jgi:tetratricopeptide (TPR) repeat protein
MGLGSSYYELGDFMNSENAFREIIRLHPRAGAAYNDLAQILMERGRYPEALEMARKAVSLGDPLQSAYHQTSQEIESEMSQ